MVDTAEGSRDGIPLPKQHVEINTKHAIVVGISDLVKTQPALAKVLAAQVFDNCLVAAGLLDDSRSMLPRLNDILVCLVKCAIQNDSTSIPSTAPEATDAVTEVNVDAPDTSETVTEVIVDTKQSPAHRGKNTTITEAEVV